MLAVTQQQMQLPPGTLQAGFGRIMLCAAADALARGAKVLEEQSPADATALYLEAVEMYENDGKEAQVNIAQQYSAQPGCEPLQCLFKQ
jgi:hypothetical protein